jgi:hypothetical protein
VIAAIYACKSIVRRAAAALLRALLIPAGAVSAFYWFVP